MDGHCRSPGFGARPGPLLPLHEDGRLSIIDPTDWIDNGHRPYQSEPRRPEPARRPRRAAHGAQRHARRRPRRPRPVGHEPQPRPPAHTVRRRAPDPGAGGHAPHPPRPRPGRPGADRARPDRGPGGPGRGVRRRGQPSGCSGSGCRTAWRCCSVPRCSPTSARRHPASGCGCTRPTGCALDELDADHLDLGVGFGALPRDRRTTSGACSVPTRTCACSMPTGSELSPPISLEDYVRLPHVLTSLRQGERGVVDEALAKLGLRRTVALTTPRFMAVPFLVAGAPVVTTMHARTRALFRRYARAQPQPDADRAAGSRPSRCSGTPPTTTIRRTYGCAEPLCASRHNEPGIMARVEVDARGRMNTRRRAAVQDLSCWSMSSRAFVAAGLPSFWRSRYTRRPSCSARIIDRCFRAVVDRIGDIVIAHRLGEALGLDRILLLGEHHVLDQRIGLVG